MKKVFSLPILILVAFSFFVFFPAAISSAHAASLKYSPSSGLVSDSFQVDVVVDTEGEAVESAVAVVEFDASKITITDFAAGGFFSDVSVDESVSGEIAITGTLTADLEEEGVTGSGVLATLTVQPLIDSGSFDLTFRCSGEEFDDSNIITIEGINLLATDEQCANNVEGTYDMEAATTTDDTTEATKGDQPVEPEELPQAGFRNWLKWITSGLALIGVGLLLL